MNAPGHARATLRRRLPSPWLRGGAWIVCMPLACVLLGACGGGTSPTPAAPVAPQEALAQVGDVQVRATALPTRSLGEVVAKRHGITRADDTAMLLVSVRKGLDDATAVSLPARVTATAIDLRGNRQAVVMRELRSGDGPGALLDAVGIVEVDVPDTLRFEVDVAYPGGNAQLVFVREFHP